MMRNLLEKGLETESSGNKKQAVELYRKAIEILQRDFARADAVEKEKIRRRMASLQSVITGLEGHTPQSTGLDEGALKTIEELGLSVISSHQVKFKDVAGLEDVKRELFTKVIYPLRFPELAKDFNVFVGGGVLFYGPPGNGKTFLAKALAGETSMNFIYVNPSTLYSKWFGSFEKNINSLFTAARGLTPCILFFDEIESLFPVRDERSSEASRRGVSQFLNEIGGFQSNGSSELLILGATNVPWVLDPAVTRPGRFDRMVYIPPPDMAARETIIRHQMEAVSRKGEIDYGQIATSTEGYSAADVEYICRYSAQNAFLKAVNGDEKSRITTAELMDSLKTIKPSVSSGLMERYVQYGKLRGSVPSQ
jgi:transitional endoplasmic reticulum ATPase